MRERKRRAPRVADGAGSRTQPGGTPGRARRKAAAAHARRRLATTTVRALHPAAVCGAATTVVHLLRVDEVPAEGAPEVHLVFFDRHGWYCEHGRECPAVAAARAHLGTSTMREAEVTR